ncbi:MAG: DUF3800 domain-containing protein [Actinobacteria bacterium]|nr:DUF3800 domain-containing protein [Actinomycetota bacterium]
MFIFLDESGDLGFDFSKSKTTRKFVITLLICDTNNAQKDFRKAVTRTLKRLNARRNKSRKVIELKGVRTALRYKISFFRYLKREDWRIYCLALNKVRVNPSLRSKLGKKKLYNFLALHLLKQLPLADVHSNVELVVDRSKNKEEIRDFNQYMANYIQGGLPLNTAFETIHLRSTESTGLQAVDLFCWGVFRKYESGDERWYKMYKHKIGFETEYLS